jgi:hypothetical protein
MGTGASYTLNVFTNLSDPDIANIPIERTLDSFEEAFSFRNVHAVNFYLHPFPFPQKRAEYTAYLNKLRTRFPRSAVHVTRGLAHGYAKSVVLSETAYCFQIEHDWLFHKENIQHSDLEILEAMRARGIHHLRLNKRANINASSDSGLEEERAGNLVVCRTPSCSNNPHFLDVGAYREKYLHLIDVGGKGAEGVGDLLSGVPYCCIYGPLDHPATISHNDGRTRLKQVRRLVGKRGYDWILKAGLLMPMLRMQDYFAKTARP